jgi:hypothetical protein
VSPKTYIFIAKVFWRIGQVAYKTADEAGEHILTEWTQKYWDWLADKMMGLSAKYLMKGYWMIDPDAEY